MIRLYYGQQNDFDRGWTIESLWKPHTKNGRFGGWPPALRAKVIIFGVCTSKYGTNRTSECYSIPAFYYAEIISLISKYFNSKCSVVNTPAAIFSQQKWRPKLGILRWNVLKSTKFFCYYGLFLLNVHITVIMTMVFMTTSGIFFLQYDMIGYYLFVCMIYVIVIFFSLYGSLLLIQYSHICSGLWYIPLLVAYHICFMASDIQ